MIVFRCDCGYTWVLDLIRAEVIGPIANGGTTTDNTTLPLFIGNQEQTITMDAFSEAYGDCWSRITRAIRKAGK